MTVPASVLTDEITMDFADAVRTASDAGLGYVDIRGVWGGFSHDVPRSRWPEMQSILDDHGVQLGAIQSNFGKCPIEGPEYDKHRAFLPTLIEQAHYFGTTVIRTFPFWQPDRETQAAVRPNLEPTLPQIVRQFRPAAELAEREGVTLALEPERSTYGGSASEVRRIIDALDSPAVRIAWDVDNGWPYEPLFPNAWEQVRGYVVNVHVKDRTFAPDHPEGRNRGLKTLLGTGALPWPRVIRSLQESGYRGLYSIETHLGKQGTYGYQKLKAATIWYMYALRELLEEAGLEAG